MKKLLVALMLCMTTLGVSSAVSAAVVHTGTTYTVYVAGSTSGNPIAASIVFDDVTASAIRSDGTLLTFSESDTALGGLDSLITLNIASLSDLFPAANETAILGVGIANDPLDLAVPVTLYNARVTLRDLVGNIVFASDNLAELAQTNSPWDGSLPTQSTLFGVGPIGGMNVVSITFDFYVSEIVSNDIPEPGSVLLCGLGLLAIVAIRHRRRSQA